MDGADATPSESTPATGPSGDQLECRAPRILASAPPRRPGASGTDLVRLPGRGTARD
jgi:hypothetical protein